VWTIITLVSISLLLILVAQENNFTLSSVFSSDDDSPMPLSNTSDEMHPLGKQCLSSHDGVEMHFHPFLTILIDDEEFTIPKDTGISTSTCNNAMHMTHTHDTTGKIHVEGNSVEEVPLEVFFDVWGKHFDETGIFDNRNGTIEMKVDGVVSTDYQNLILKDGQNIIISYSSN